MAAWVPAQLVLASQVANMLQDQSQKCLKGLSRQVRESEIDCVSRMRDKDVVIR